MNQNEFEKLCKQIADVPWEFGPYAAWAGSQIEYYRDCTEITMRLSTGLDLLRIVFTDAPSPQQIATARSFFGDLELRHIAREIAPKAKWEFVDNWAHIPGLAVERFPSYFSIEIRDRGGFVASMAENTTTELIAAYREHRAKHEAARGVKTRQPKPAPALPSRVNYAWEAQPLWYPPDLDCITIEHARNILACMADPEKYTRIARWAKSNPSQAARIMRTALEVTK